MIFYVSYSLWFILSATAVFKGSINLKVLFFILPFYFAMIFYPYLSDLKHYYQAFQIDIYRANFGFVKLQELLKSIFGIEIGFALLIFLPIIVLLFISLIGNSKAAVFLLSSQLLVLLPFNGMRQGYAIFFLLIAAYFLNHTKFKAGLFFLIISCLFHSSAIFIFPIVIGFYMIKIFRKISFLPLLFIALVAFFATHFLETLFIYFDIFSDYFEKKNFTEGRTDPRLKYLIFALYFIVSNVLMRKQLSYIPELTYIKFFIFFLSIFIFIYIDLSELAARIMIYYLAFESFSLFILAKRQVRIAISMRTLWFLSNTLSPSVLGILSLPIR